MGSPQQSLPLFADDEIASPEPHVAELRKALNQTLRESREVLHRRGRFSSRNEALDEICKLLFAHLVVVSQGDEGVPAVVEGAQQPAQALKGFVRSAFERYLPSSLAHEMPVDDFDLRLKSSESDLAVELGDAFRHLGSDGTLDMREIAGEADVLNEVFGAFLTTSFVDEKQLGQYLTPPEVIRFIVDLALDSLDAQERKLLTDPSTCARFGVVLDPSCGVGSFLTQFARQLYRELRASGEEEARRWLDGILASGLCGIDKSERMIRLALTNLALLSARQVNLHLANALARSGSDAKVTDALLGQVGLIMTNPPFGAEFRGNDLKRYQVASEWTRRTPAKVDSEVLFIERYIDWLRPGGRAFVIVPDSILMNRGIFSDLRRAIKDRVEVELVVSLPAVTFEAAGTSTKTSVLQFRKLDCELGRKSREKAYVAICHEIGFSVGTRASHRLKLANEQSDLPIILEEVRNHSAHPSLGRRILDLGSADRWDATYHASLPPEIERLLADPPEGALFVRDVASLSVDRVDPQRGEGDTFLYIEISDVDSATGFVRPKPVARAEAPSRARRLVRSGDVLVSTVRPERRAIAVVPDEADGAVCSTGFAVLRPTAISSQVLAHVLRTPFVTAQVLRNNGGIAYPAIDECCLPEILLPIAGDKVASADEAGRAVARAEAEWSRARACFAQEMSALLDEPLTGL